MSGKRESNKYKCICNNVIITLRTCVASESKCKGNPSNTNTKERERKGKKQFKNRN